MLERAIPMTFSKDDYKKWQQQGQRKKTGKSFYDSPAWRKLRAAYRAQFPLCQLNCSEGCSKDMPRLAESVDHFVPARVDPNKALEWSNLRSACKPCNTAKEHTDKEHWPMLRGPAAPIVPTSGPIDF